MTWFWFALAAPALWGIVNHVDKFVISKYFKGSGLGSLVVFTSLSGFILSIGIIVFNFDSIVIAPQGAFIIAASGALLIAAFIPYLYALDEADPSIVAALFQLIPVFDYFLAFFFLGERLTTIQLIASRLVLVGTLIISLDFTEGIRLRRRPFLLMLLSSAMIAIDAFLFKFVALEASFWGTTFWGYMGGVIFGAGLLLFTSTYRRQFFAVLKENKLTIVSLNIASELLYNVGKIFATYASLLAPLALTRVVASTQPLMVFVYGILLAYFIPRWGGEKLEKKFLLHKFIAIGVIFVGVYLLLR